MFKGKKFLYVGKSERGSHVVVEKTSEEDALTVTLDEVKSGQALKLGEGICQVKQDDDGTVEIEAVDTGGGGGPPMVSSAPYRSGWDRTFGSRGVN